MATLASPLCTSRCMCEFTGTSHQLISLQLEGSRNALTLLANCLDSSANNQEAALSAMNYRFEQFRHDESPPTTRLTSK
eukprot:2522828-Amphidinium_carterae.1